MGNKKWYQKTPGIIVLLVLFFPVGLFVMWKYASWPSKAKWVISGIFVFIILTNLLDGDNKQNPSNVAPEPTTQAPTPDTSRVDFKASVVFTGTQFVITNEDDLDCLAPEIKINSGLFGGGYSLKTSTFLSGETYVIEAMTITKGDGERFNPLTTAPKNIYISCGKGNDLYAASYMAELQ